MPMKRYSPRKPGLLELLMVWGGPVAAEYVHSVIMYLCNGGAATHALFIHIGDIAVKCMCRFFFGYIKQKCQRAGLPVVNSQQQQQRWRRNLVRLPSVCWLLYSFCGSIAWKCFCWKCKITSPCRHDEVTYTFRCKRVKDFFTYEADGSKVL